MRIETEAFLMGSTDIHSAKSGKDFVKINLIVEGEFTGFFTRKSDGDRIRTAKPFQELAKTKSPTRCVATLDFKFTQKGVFCDLVGIA
jgi:hypothetical protein